MSGVAPLVLTLEEIKLIDQHFKNTLERLQKLPTNTPTTFVLFLGGSLPGKAILHQRQLSLFGMICRLPDNVLHTIAREKLNYVKKSMKSWFTTV